jgi:hypothetical protein
VGITDVHKIRLVPLSLSGMAFSLFTSLMPNSIDVWPTMEQKFHNYFYNGEVELRLSDFTTVGHRHGETVPEYLKRFRETRNRCYELTIGEKDHADLAFAGLSSYLREKMEGQQFFDVNQVLQQAIAHENHTEDQRLHGQFKENTFREREREKQNVNCVSEESASDEEGKVCVAEWVHMPKDKPISYSFLKPNAIKKDEMKFTFDVSKCVRLFDKLVKGG